MLSSFTLKLHWRGQKTQVWTKERETVSFAPETRRKIDRRVCITGAGMYYNIMSYCLILYFPGTGTTVGIFV